jgi:UPF0755 protein
VVEANGNSSSPTRFSAKRAVAAAALFLCAVFLLLTGWLMVYAISPGPAAPEKSAIVTIPRGTPLKQMATVLAGAGLVREDLRFAILAKICGYSGKIRAGEFKLTTGNTPLAVLGQLAKAQPVQHAVTIPEGLRIEEIGSIFARGGWCDEERFRNLAYEQAFISGLGFGRLKSLEGYLFPDTYLLTRDIHGEEELIRLMTRRFSEVWGEVAPGAVSQEKRHEVVILASMIEKEAQKEHERPIIAGVFHNRLKKGMKLQSDPTVIYGIEEYDGNITKKHLQTPSSYNTYTLSGLPAGPISNPGRAALAAALKPAATEFLFFVGKNDGSHQFSRTLEEHNQAVQKYQRKKSEKNGKG